MKSLRWVMFLSLAALMLSACRSAGGSIDGGPAVGTTVYSTAGLHFDAQRGRYIGYSTNYTELPVFKPAGSEFQLVEKNRKYVTLRDGDGVDYLVRFIPKHTRMPMGEWLDRLLVTAPIELPSELSEMELEAIAAGQVKNGMSRVAVALAVGYPPASLNPTLDGKIWNYEARRFVSRQVEFDDSERVIFYGRR